jgi:ATP-dependent helicase HrpA
MIVRAERAKSNIAKDMEKAKRIAPHEADYQTLRSIKNPSQQQLAGIQDYFILLEEFKVSLFAQELGTGQKVSPKRLDQLASRIRNA